MKAAVKGEQVIIPEVHLPTAVLPHPLPEHRLSKIKGCSPRFRTEPRTRGIHSAHFSPDKTGRIAGWVVQFRGVRARAAEWKASCRYR